MTVSCAGDDGTDAVDSVGWFSGADEGARVPSGPSEQDACDGSRVVLFMLGVRVGTPEMVTEDEDNGKDGDETGDETGDEDGDTDPDVEMVMDVAALEGTSVESSGAYVNMGTWAEVSPLVVLSVARPEAVGVA